MQSVVASGAPATTQAAREILAAGGNAVDAAVAAGFAMPVAEPGLASLGGGGFMMVRHVDGSVRLIDFFAAVPRPRGDERQVVSVNFEGTIQDFAVGPATVAVPGVLQGLIHAHQRYGRLHLRTVIAPALRYAEYGVELTEAQAYVLSLIEEGVCLTDASRAVYAPNGRILTAGDTIRNEAYAQFLSSEPRRLPAAHAVPQADLEDYRVIERDPLEVDLARGRLLTNPFPSLGGPIIADACAQLDVTDGTAADIVAAVAAATERARRAHVVSVRGTTHVSVAARDQLVAMTVSNGSCSGVMLGDTGVQLNNMMGESDLPFGGIGERISSMMAPSFLEMADRTVAFGTGGSERIRSAMVRVIGRLLAGDDLATAIDAPRIHQDNEGLLHAEPGVPAHELLELPGCTVWPRNDVYFGGVHAVTTDGDAYADARRGGSVG